MCAMNKTTQKILVVDDDPVVATSFNRVLTNKGYVVITAQNAREALTKLQNGGYDLVFTDIKMPGMDGLELAEQVKARRPWTPVVIITGYGTEANEARAKAAGVTAFLQKPLSPEMIEDSAAAALEGPRAAPTVVARIETRTVETVTVAPAKKENLLKNIALFIAAPFIGLVYAILLPFVGAGLLAGLGFKALMKIPAAKRTIMFLANAGKLIAAPFIGLAFILLFPFIGMAMLIWTGMRALTTKVHAG